MRLCARLVDPSLDAGLPMWSSDWAGVLAAAGVPFTVNHDDGEGVLVLPYPDAFDGPVAPGRPVLTGPPPGDWFGALRDALGGLAVPDLRGVLVLRMDDPGAAVKRHLASWRHPPVSTESWSALWATLSAAGGRASVFCCPGWVDDDGSVVPSRAASPEEWTALDEGVRLGVADLECHGHTHVDVERWASADPAERAAAVELYREMWPPLAPAEPSVDDQLARLRAWQEACGPGTALVAPGEAWGANTVTAARRAGLRLFNSWGVCRLDLPVPTWSAGVGSPYLDEPSPSWFEGGLFAVGYWHDRDMAVHGPGWAPDWLGAWQDCGARRLIAFADLAAAYAVPVEAELAGGEVVVRSAPAGWPLRVELAAA